MYIYNDSSEKQWRKTYSGRKDQGKSDLQEALMEIKTIITKNVISYEVVS